MPAASHGEGRHFALPGVDRFYAGAAAGRRRSARAEGGRMLEPRNRRRSTLDRLDDGLLVVAGIVGVLLVLQVVSWVVGTVLFVIKLAVVAAVVFVILRVLAAVRRNGPPAPSV